MPSQDFSTITNKLRQLQHKTLPPRFEFIQLKAKNSLIQYHFLVIYVLQAVSKYIQRPKFTFISILCTYFSFISYIRRTCY